MEKEIEAILDLMQIKQVDASQIGRAATIISVGGKPEAKSAITQMLIDARIDERNLSNQSIEYYRSKPLEPDTIHRRNKQQTNETLNILKSSNNHRIIELAKLKKETK